MKIKCSKCKTIDELCESRSEGAEVYNFCKLCAIVLNKDHRTMNISSDFLKENFGNFDCTDIDKYMINARIRRAKNEHVWNT